MTPFRRAPSPAFWEAKVSQWASRSAAWATLDPLGWIHQRRPLRDWFHELCREEGPVPLCAYCDGQLDVTSRSTIDHFAPRERFQALSLTWNNLFPACDLCNETYKRERWSCSLVRPDRDPVEEWFDFEPTTGKLRPSAAVEDRHIRARVRLTIAVFGLNTPERCRARRGVVKDLQNAWKRDARTSEHDRPTVAERAERGPFRFVVRRFLDAVPASEPRPEEAIGSGPQR
jgi:uncharacterized protein (TIGR02646 family)